MTEPNHHLYDELIRLDEKLATLQRQLAEQNAELEGSNEQIDRVGGTPTLDLRPSPPRPADIAL